MLEGIFPVSVYGDGLSLLLKIDWLNALQNSKILHRRWLKNNSGNSITLYDTRYAVFQNILKQGRKHAQQMIRAVQSFPNPFLNVKT